MASTRFVPPETSLEAFIEEQANKNMLSKTKRDVSLIKEFIRMKGKDEEFKNIEPRELDQILFDRYLRKKGYTTAIIEGQKFRKTRETLVAKQKELKNVGKGKKTKAAHALTDEEVDVLYGKELLGLSSPESLLNTLWLNNTQQFGLRGCQEHRTMRWGDVQLKTSADGTEFLEYTERQTKTRTGTEPKDTCTVKLKMFSVPGSDRDPVQAFHLYASKRPEQMNSEDRPFYLAVNLTKMASSSKPWFKAVSVGVNKLNSLMKTMAQKAGLNKENLANQRGQKRMIQKLNDQEVPPTHIMKISGPKNVQSLNNYSSLSEKQQRNISNTLSSTTSTRRSLASEEIGDVSL
ncbi:uncharacterized protein KIAA1958-like [Montipora foliosa]|uniref:uncharacterized protein KIAA1958-like n=1 Tax=Montipora foliosa TaxID=591990 RepID=UPI0035F148BA